MTIVGGGERYARLFREGDHAGNDGFYFLLEPVVLNFEIVVAPAEYVFKLFRLARGFVEFVGEQQRRRHSRKAGGERDKPFAVRRQQFFVDARFVVVAVSER